ncbi:bifunctional adenosylcobinamide kinase/adenosylcobinamide-phosphate guanylyltransferase [Fulvivirgaceae bacterium BMA10]|uniref:Adenosylcobinamide kinase n=1 Tax=Splendidivirga corallicola TaxID=3051826 RepID=A0ABT8KTL7_9BACT|nr:bifunctional adenosylcobinamide kinase/adenosylcobinamide-phosphate guanylyltransferase [Fulvivirgaceae bacterium BMA10]
MITFITGGARSGKSKFAQELALKNSKEPIYIATAKIWDKDFEQRIKQHQTDRGSEWTNYEAHQELYQLPIQNRVVVIDCVTLWLTNYFVEYKNDVERSLQEFKLEINALSKMLGHFIIISNELGMSMHAETEVGRKFTDLQGWANQYVANKANEVILMVSGLPMYVKVLKC